MQSIQQLIDIMRALRDPESGCPWDLEQDFQSLIPFTIEEAYEVADAIERNDIGDIKSELGDLLFQIIFYCQLADEQQAFDFNDVVQSINDKLTRRHPHVFADATVKDSAAQTKEWEKIKQQERKTKAASSSATLSHLDDVSRTLPSLMRAEKLQKRAAKEGFDWPNIKGVMAKVIEELDEVQQELDAKKIEQDKLENEIGDLFFSCINLSRHAGVDAEQSLRKANLKFERRFRSLEKLAEEKNKQINDMTADELESLWQEVKKHE
ncbi:MAG TPA: nucleoside triphosphate pyrophosphohydrolase [Gammaproteobacteria bacterium]|nr:nucleoside triphosphate pyrophosphohydrolase [Gammaproteobacteria bacterium]